MGKGSGWVVSGSGKGVQNLMGLKDWEIKTKNFYQYEYHQLSLSVLLFIFIIRDNFIFVNDIWNKSYMNCGNEMKMKKWSSQWTQFMHLRKEAWKKFRTSTGFEPVTSRLPVRCSTNWAMKPLTLGAGQLWVHNMFPWKKWVLMIYEINHNMIYFIYH